MKRIGILILLGLISLQARVTPAQGLVSDGRDFYVGLLYPSFNAQPISFFGRNVQGFYGVYVLISSYENNQVTVGYFDDLGNEVAKATYNISKRHAIQMPLDVSRMRMTEPGEIPEYKSCHITAKKPINVQYFSTGSCSGGSYLALPTGTLGRKYVVQSYHDNVGGVGGALSHEDASGYFMVIAAFDSTRLEITPSSSTKGKHPGVYCGPGATGAPQPFGVGLNRGQCYMVKGSATDASCDISGSTIVSNHPVAVIAGHENALTDGSDPQPAGSLTLEARDYMVEQMLPVEYWDTTGYFSIPLLDSKPPAVAGEGDEYKLFTGIIPSTASAGPGYTDAGMNNGTRLFQHIGPYQSPEPAIWNVTTPVHFYSTNGTKMGVALYDQRMQGGGAPYPAPSQMTIIPKSLWKRSYLWYVPNNTFEILQGYYINVLCYREDYDNQRLNVAFNDSRPAPMNTLALKKEYHNIPDNDSLAGYTFSVGPGAYYATVDSTGHPFMVYNYGFRAIDPDRDLGDFCGDDHFFEYALPIGFGRTGTGAKMSVTVDTNCTGWHICVTDNRNSNRGIKTIMLLDDPRGDLVQPARQSSNVHFDPNLDPSITHEIEFSGQDTSVCFDVFATDPLQTGFAPLYIIDVDGNGTLLDLTYNGVNLKLITEPGFGNGTNAIQFPDLRVGHDTCTIFKYTTDIEKPVLVSQLALNTPSTTFAITNINPPLPVTLSKGDTLSVTVCFSPSDTGAQSNAINLTTTCQIGQIALTGNGTKQLIYATDYNYSPTDLGDTLCGPITITNVGTAPMRLLDAKFRTAGPFALDSVSKARLPLLLNPKQAVTLSVCFSPKFEDDYMAIIDWVTDADAGVSKLIKDSSVLRASGVLPQLAWSEPIIYIYADSNSGSPVGIRRVSLNNASLGNAFVQSVHFNGTDSSEFLVAGNQFGYVPMERFTVNSGKALWVDVGWHPDILKPYPARYADRVIDLVALYETNTSGPRIDSTVIHIVGTFDIAHSDVHISVPTKPGTIEATAGASTIGIRTPVELHGVCDIELYDIIGRLVAKWIGVPLLGKDAIELPLPKLNEGAYVLRISNGGIERSCKVIVK